MADDRLDLIQRLCLEAGRRMEDASPEFAQPLPSDSVALEQRLNFRAEVAGDLMALSQAAQALQRPV
jgi:hypothetical protein